MFQPSEPHPRKCSFESLSTFSTNSLALEILHEPLHVVHIGLQPHLLVAQAVELSAQVCDVGLEHAVDVGACGGLVLQEAPLGLQHLVLLLQEAHLQVRKMER